MKQGIVFVISAPSGTGKHSVLHPIMARDPNIEYSISATTRPPRPGELDGRDYHFLSEAEFRRRLEAGEFAESANVYRRLYGTLHSELDRRIGSGKDVVLEIDVQGMRSLKRMRPDAVTVFILPPSIEALAQRLRGRGANDEADMALRIENARGEMAASNEYDYIVVNDKLEDAVADMEAIIRAERCRNRRPQNA